LHSCASTFIANLREWVKAMVLPEPNATQTL